MGKYYCVHVEFYDHGKPKACVTSKEADKLPDNQFRQIPGLAAFKIWFSSANHTMKLLDLIKREECYLDDVLSLFSDKRKLLRRKGTWTEKYRFFKKAHHV